MGFFDKLFGKKKTVPPIPKGITVEQSANEVNISINTSKLVAYVQSDEYKKKVEERERPVYATEEQIDSLPLSDTKNGKVRRIKCSIMPTTITSAIDGTYVGMCEVRKDDVLFPYIDKDGSNDWFGDIYSKDVKKFLPLGECKLPYLAYVYKDWEYFQNTKAYYDEERRIEIIVYLGSVQDVSSAMKEDLSSYNDKVKTDKHTY